MLQQIREVRNVDYWLHRLAYLPVSEIPADVIPLVIEYANHPEERLRNLALAVLNKDPFQVIANPSTQIVETNTATDDAPNPNLKSEEDLAAKELLSNPFKK